MRGSESVGVLRKMSVTWIKLDTVVRYEPVVGELALCPVLEAADLQSRTSNPERRYTMLIDETPVARVVWTFNFQMSTDLPRRYSRHNVRSARYF